MGIFSLSTTIYLTWPPIKEGKQRLGNELTEMHLQPTLSLQN